jgi:Tol biopolymer transport system component
MNCRTMLLFVSILATILIVVGCSGGTPTPQLPAVIIITPTTVNVFGTIVAQTPSPTQTPTTTPTNTPEMSAEAGKRIAFIIGDQSDTRKIVAINDDGSAMTDLTDPQADPPGLFDWSPDGEQMAFVTGYGYLAQDFRVIDIWKMNADGSNRVKLVSPTGSLFTFTWSPDGSRIAFDAYKKAGVGKIYVMNSDGSGLTQLPCSSASCSLPTWSPDGERLSFIGSDSPEVNIYAIAADGTGEINLSNSSAVNVATGWSPDGKQIAFSSNRDSPKSWEIYVMNSDGSKQTRLTQLSLRGWAYTVWSPDGTRLAVASPFDIQGPIYVVNADGSGLIKLADEGASPMWSPDGKRIAFASGQEGKSNIFVINVDGSELTQLTSTGNNYSPQWQP